MRNQYEYPDDPEVFARVLEHFRTMSIADWEARLDRYAHEELMDSSQTERASVTSVAALKQKSKTTVPRSKPTKRVRGTSAK